MLLLPKLDVDSEVDVAQGLQGDYSSDKNFSVYTPIG